MNVRPSDGMLVVHFSGASVDHVEEVESGLLVAYDADSKIVDISVRARFRGVRLDVVGHDVEANGARVTYDEAIDALSIDALSSDYRESEEVRPGFVVDYDDDGFVRGFEFLNASAFFSGRTMDDIRKCARLL